MILAKTVLSGPSTVSTSNGTERVTVVPPAVTTPTGISNNKKSGTAALDLYPTLIELMPGNAQVHSNLGVTLFYLGREDEAVRSFETPRAALEQIRNAL